LRLNDASSHSGRRRFAARLDPGIRAVRSAPERTEPEAQRTSQWREVTGVVLYSQVEYWSEYYRPIVKYKYEVDGVTYQGESIVKGLIEVNWKAPAARWVKRFPVGATVPVFVDPLDPRKCFLQLGRDSYFPFAVAFVGVIIAVLVYVFAFAVLS
jgi:hypothetical protein